MRLLFNFSLMVMSTKSSSLPMSAPGNVLLFALLVLNLNRCGASMKSIWFCTCPFGACQVTVPDGLCGCSVFARVSWWLLANSRILKLYRWSLLSQTYLLFLTSLGMRLVQPNYHVCITDFNYDS
ncbi:hypothetical protein DPMN_117437 [Dreissena polymorpha]|uniref:Secreted protein n=1 Tax=Dreissena polymorpha TaxID=45954 RepID=A0A9D4KQL3_DREPO|nr:hypothetical protein DPMN_117437 [Dreissena polymorpha]